MRIPHVIVGAALAAAVLASTGAAPAAVQPSSDAVARGKTTFLDSCAVCHGDKGRGDGPAAPALKPRPADLSRLAKQYGEFPAAHVTATLNGTATVIAHGNPGMMIWQAIFLAQDAGNQEKADARIADVVAYIESIQRK